MLFKVGQGTLGLPQRQYYANESDLTVAYRHFMWELAKALTNNTTAMLEQDVEDIFQFEKNISRVRLSQIKYCISFILLCSIIGQMMNNELEIMKQFEQQLLIFHLNLILV
jgi:hypothetical protein